MRPRAGRNAAEKVKTYRKPMKNGQKRYVLTLHEAPRRQKHHGKRMRCLKQALEQLALFTDMFVGRLPDNTIYALPVQKMALEA